MLLRISVLQIRGRPPGRLIAHIFDEKGGSIGREPENQLVLPDPTRVISRVQSRISYANGEFRLTDEGGNASTVNGLRVGRGNSRSINDGDVIECGDYKLHVRAIRPPDPTQAPEPEDEEDFSMDFNFEDVSTVTQFSARKEEAAHDEIVAALRRGLQLDALALENTSPEFAERLGAVLRAALQQTLPEPADDFAQRFSANFLQAWQALNAPAT